jgi:3-oxoacyl-[acyl-carrier protein] reductase
MPKVFITGGAVRLGRGLALKFAEKGWDVAFSYYHSAEKAKVTSNEITKHNVRNYNFQVDLRNYKQLCAEFEKMIDVFGIPDVVINNAAVFPPKKSLTELKVEEWHSVLDANLNSVFYVSKIFAEYA